MKKHLKFEYISIIILSSLFIILSCLIISNKTTNFDNYIYEKIILLYPNWTNIFKIITFLGSTIFIVLISLYCLFFIKKNKNYFIVLCIIVSTILNNFLKVIFKRERPSILMLVEETSYSFPSGHTMASTSLYGLFIYLIWQTKLQQKWKILITIILCLLILLIGISRIYLGAHFATDVIGSLIMSGLLLNIYILISKKYLK